MDHRFDACVTEEQTGINGGADGKDGWGGVLWGGRVSPPLFLLSPVIVQKAIDTALDPLSYTCTTSET